MRYLSRKFADSRKGVTPDDIELCLYSMADNNTFLYYNRDPCDQVCRHLLGAGQ